jgi:hypothetical protein
VRWPAARLVVFRVWWSCLVLVLGLMPLVLIRALGRAAPLADGPAPYDPGREGWELLRRWRRMAFRLRCDRT